MVLCLYVGINKGLKPVAQKDRPEELLGDTFFSFTFKAAVLVFVEVSLFGLEPHPLTP